MRTFVIFSAILMLSVQPLAGQQSQALDLDDVVALLGISASADVRADLIRNSCVSFPLDAAATSRLRSAGADDALIGVIRTACFTGVELVVESHPIGAEVLVNNERVGTTPWTQRYATARAVTVVVGHNGRTLQSAVTLQQRYRARASFGFLEDTVAVPRVPAATDVAQRLRLADSWKPLTPPPPRPMDPILRPTDLIENVALLIGPIAAGTAYCAKASHQCGLKDGDTGFGFIGGMIGGAIVGGVLNKIKKSYQQGKYERALSTMEQWKRDDAAARAAWIQTHPQLRSTISEAERQRAEAVAKNSGIKARNALLVPVRVTSEALPGRQHD